MGILSWFRSLRSSDVPDEPRSLLRYRYEDPASQETEETEEAAAADVAAVEEDDKYFGSDSPADQDGVWGRAPRTLERSRGTHRLRSGQKNSWSGRSVTYGTKRSRVCLQAVTDASVPPWQRTGDGT